MHLWDLWLGVLWRGLAGGRSWGFSWRGVWLMRGGCCMLGLGMLRGGIWIRIVRSSHYILWVLLILVGVELWLKKDVEEPETYENSSWRYSGPGDPGPGTPNPTLSTLNLTRTRTRTRTSSIHSVHSVHSVHSARSLNIPPPSPSSPTRSRVPTHSHERGHGYGHGYGQLPPPSSYISLEMQRPQPRI
ncbi:hypothetical protein SISSUDRAFT_926546 [Sistotremastrum suecicum HHB10207 ss-3]|uniref:Uncharacterized protein n=1 Tax=Sistotremastrum suecicum HHB10207 ss-3 TaxID=1314776 RepID=A0A166BTS7_9AGAM|nr:hypothetical protein SISSUDRAFT_926546 [Sistotremastrum suecicum HHB10207 ss-3]